jgi:hypothetical protein
MTDHEYKLFGEAVAAVNARGWVVAALRQMPKPGSPRNLYWHANVGAKMSDYPKLPIGDLFSETGTGATAHEALRDALNRTALRTTGLVEHLTAAFRAAAEAR